MRPTIEKLKEMHLEKILKKIPALIGREYAAPKYTQKPNTTNGLTRCIVDYLNLSGHVATRISSTGSARVTGKKEVNFYSGLGKSNITFVPGTQRKGMADIRAIIKHPAHTFGVPVELEIKFSRSDRQRKEQKSWQKDVESAGGLYVIIRSFEDFADWYEQFMKL